MRVRTDSFGADVRPSVRRRGMQVYISRSSPLPGRTDGRCRIPLPPLPLYDSPKHFMSTVRTREKNPRRRDGKSIKAESLTQNRTSLLMSRCP